MKDVNASVRRFCSEYLTPITVMTHEEWLASCRSYSEGRKEELRAEYKELKGHPPSKRACQHIDSFVKAEAYGMFKYPRMINSRSDSFKTWSGPYFKSMEEEVYKLHWFIKHVPVAERPAHIARLKKDGLIYYQTDYTAFESHFTPLILKNIECEVYRFLLKAYPQAYRTIERTLCGTNRMRTSTGVRCSVKGRRMSGDMCTSLGNGLTNLLLVKYIVEDLKHGHFDGFVEGDDGLFACSVPLEKTDFFNLGFTIKINEDGPINDPCHASFCGMVFAQSGQIIKDPRRFLNEFGWSSSFIGASHPLRLGLLRAKALSACYETPDCPIIGQLARSALIVTREAYPRFVSDGYHDAVQLDEVNLKPFNPSPDTRDLFALKYGISVESQIEAEALIRSGRLSEVINHIEPHPDTVWYALRCVETRVG